MHAILKDKKVVFFDIGYTIFYPASGDWMFTNRFLEVAGERFKKYTASQIREARMKGEEYLLHNHLCHDEDVELERIKHFYEMFSSSLGLGLTDEEILSVAKDHTFNAENYVKYPDAVKVLSKLSDHFSLGIISDTWPSLETKLKKHGLDKYFSFATYSFDLGVYKPDPKMFADALSKCGCDADKTVFIDDRPENLAGAEKFGITPVLIAATPGSDPETSFFKIHSLSDLL